MSSVLDLTQAAQESSSHDEVPFEDYTLHRIIHGVPEGPTDIPPGQAFPMDSNMDFMGGSMSRCCWTIYSRS